MRIAFYYVLEVVIVTTLLFISFPEICFSQQSSIGIKALQDSTLNIKSDGEFGSGLSIGVTVGDRLFTNNDNSQILYGGKLDFNFSLNGIQENTFFSVGFQFYKYKVNDRDASGFGGIISLYPSFAFNTSDKKFTFLGGLGYHFIIDNYFVSLLYISGTGPFLTFKAQYNLNKHSGLGINLETFMFKEADDSESAHKGFLLNSTFFYSFTF